MARHTDSTPPAWRDASAVEADGGATAAARWSRTVGCGADRRERAAATAPEPHTRKRKRWRSHPLGRRQGCSGGGGTLKSASRRLQRCSWRKRSTVRAVDASRRQQRSASVGTRSTARPSGGEAHEKDISLVRRPRGARGEGGADGGGGCCRGRQTLGYRRVNTRKGRQRWAGVLAMCARGSAGCRGDGPSAWQGVRLEGGARTGGLARCCIQWRKPPDSATEGRLYSTYIPSFPPHSRGEGEVAGIWRACP